MGIEYRFRELAFGEIPAFAIHQIVEVPSSINIGFNDSTSENVLNHKRCHAALAACWIVGKPLTRCFQGPCLFQGGLKDCKVRH